MKVIICSAGTKSLKWFRMDMMRDLIDAGCEVVALGDSRDVSWHTYFESRGIRYRSFFVQRNGTNPFQDLKTISDLKHIFLEELPDKVFVYHAKANIYGSIAAKAAGISDVYAMVGGLGSLYNGDGLKKRFLRTIIAFEYRFAFRFADRVFFQNEDDLNYFVSSRIVKLEKTTMVRGSGVNLNHFKQREVPEKPCFLMIARLTRDKGVLEYLEACRLLKKDYPEVVCMLVGPYDTNPTSLSQEALEPYIRSGVIEYFGEQEDVRPFLDRCSVYVLPSYREGTPKSILEAMATGRAIITTDAPGCRDTVQDKVNGFLVPVRNIEDLVKSMAVMAADREMVQAMGLASREVAEKDYDVKAVNQIIIETMHIQKKRERSHGGL